MFSEHKSKKFLPFQKLNVETQINEFFTFKKLISGIHCLNFVSFWRLISETVRNHETMFWNYDSGIAHTVSEISSMNDVENPDNAFQK